MKDPDRDLFKVTDASPYLPVREAINTHLGKTGGGYVLAGEEARVDIGNQDFLLFRGLRSEDQVSAFARRYGMLGLKEGAAEELGLKVNLRPLWIRALSQEPEAYTSFREPIADWLIQAGLMDLAVGLLGLISSPGARRSLVSALGKIGGARGLGRLDAQEEVARRTSSWAVASVLSGAAAACLSCSLGSDGSLGTPELRLHPVGWRDLVVEGRLIRPTLLIQISEAEIRWFLVVRMLRSWVNRVRASLMIEGNQIFPAHLRIDDLLAIFWLQLANALLSGVSPRMCGWERCPGPPDRPNVFLWRWGSTRTGIKHSDSIYCHPACQHAAAVERTRRSPASSRGRRAVVS
jgi:hypothetical protein